ncbi:MAG: hypothetical protein AAGJ32_07010 [Pseudomonadota bacterium]
MAQRSRVVFHEKLLKLRERFGLDLRLDGLADARRADVPVQPIHHLIASVIMVGVGIIMLGMVFGLMIGINGALTGAPTTSIANQEFIQNSGLAALIQGSDGASRLGYSLVTVAGLLMGLGFVLFGAPLVWARAVHDQLVQMISPPFTRRPYAVYLRRTPNTDAPGPLDLSIASEAKFTAAFARHGPTASVGSHSAGDGADVPAGTARVMLKNRDDVWVAAVDTLDADAVFTAVDVTDPTDRVLAFVKQMANQKNGPRFGLLIALGTPERRMQSWRAVAKSIAGSPAQVTPVAPKAPPIAMLIDGSIWTALGQGPHAQGGAQLEVLLNDRVAQDLFDIAAKA